MDLPVGRHSSLPLVLCSCPALSPRNPLDALAPSPRERLPPADSAHLGHPFRSQADHCRRTCVVGYRFGGRDIWPPAPRVSYHPPPPRRFQGSLYGRPTIVGNPPAAIRPTGRTRRPR